MLRPVNLRTFLSLSAVAFGGLALAGCSTTPTKFTEARCYELRTYWAAPGKLDALNARMRDHGLRILTKHGIEPVAFWEPVTNSESKLLFLLAYPSREARDAAWKAIGDDPEWQAVRRTTEADGPLVVRVDNVLLETTEYSPRVRTGNVAAGGVFEMRTYIAVQGRLPALDARFRDHTRRLFTRHGIKNWAYFHPMPDQPAADVTLLYFIAHASTEAAKASFDAFRADPDWIAARTASETAAGGPLTVPDGVKSLFLRATDYSPTK